MSSRLPDDAELPASWGEAWRADEPSPAQVRGAYLRFSRRREARASATFLQVARWVLSGVCIGVGSVYAASGGLRLLERSTPAAQAPLTTRPQPVLPRPARGAVPEVAASSVPEPPASTRREPARSTPSAVANERWQRAARGLRGEDFDSAHAALEELAMDGDDAQRESARLVQAQLLLSQGERERARALLEELRASARSPSVQRKTNKLLSQIDEPPPSNRSFEPPAGANEP